MVKLGQMHFTFDSFLSWFAPSIGLFHPSSDILTVWPIHHMDMAAPDMFGSPSDKDVSLFHSSISSSQSRHGGRRHGAIVLSDSMSSPDSLHYVVDVQQWRAQQRWYWVRLSIAPSQHTSSHAHPPTGR